MEMPFFLRCVFNCLKNKQNRWNAKNLKIIFINNNWLWIVDFLSKMRRLVQNIRKCFNFIFIWWDYLIFIEIGSRLNQNDGFVLFWYGLFSSINQISQSLIWWIYGIFSTNSIHSLLHQTILLDFNLFGPKTKKK